VNTIFSDLPNRAIIQVASSVHAGQRDSIPCKFDGIQGKRAQIVSQQRLPISTAITVEYNDTMLLGEVVACTRNVDDMWHIEVRVEQVLTGLQSLMTLRARLLGEQVPEFSMAGAGRR